MTLGYTFAGLFIVALSLSLTSMIMSLTDDMIGEIAEIVTIIEEIAWYIKCEIAAIPEGIAKNDNIVYAMYRVHETFVVTPRYWASCVQYRAVNWALNAISSIAVIMNMLAIADAIASNWSVMARLRAPFSEYLAEKAADTLFAATYLLAANRRR